MLSMTQTAAIRINQVLTALYELEKTRESVLLADRSERQVRAAAEYLAGLAYAKLGSGVHPDDLAGRKLAVRL